MEAHPYDRLTPDLLLQAVEQAGLHPSGSLLALNSYENRVYQFGLEEGGFVIGKFYRPERWSDDALREEHAFAAELAAAEVPVVVPLADAAGETLHRHAGFRYALFPRRGGRWPELEDPEVQMRLGRFLGRLHQVGAAREFRYRPDAATVRQGREAARYLLERSFLPNAYRSEYESLTALLLEQVEAAFAAVPNCTILRLHGDFHPGNILWTETGAQIVDLDDSRMGPAVQDIWMLLSGDRGEMTGQLSEILEGYETFADFDRRELRLIEPLRTLRIIQYHHWLARRWSDPAFPAAFPWFDTERGWEAHLLGLREQRQRLEMPPLTLQ